MQQSAFRSMAVRRTDRSAAGAEPDEAGCTTRATPASSGAGGRREQASNRARAAATDNVGHVGKAPRLPPPEMALARRRLTRVPNR